MKENETGLWAAIVRARELLPQGVNILSTFNNKINQSSALLWLIDGVQFYIIISAFLRKKDKKTNQTGVSPFLNTFSGKPDKLDSFVFF